MLFQKHPHTLPFSRRKINPLFFRGMDRAGVGVGVGVGDVNQQLETLNLLSVTCSEQSG